MQITYGGHQIVYSLERVRRKTLGITVRPDASVAVRAPVDAADEAVENIVRRRASWVVRQQRFFDQFQPRTPAREYVGGETHLYLGRRYRLRLSVSDVEQVAITSGYLCIGLPPPTSPEQVKVALDDWYRQRAHEVFPERLRLCRKIAAFQSLPSPRLCVRRMRKRWGSCSSAHVLTINTDLIRAPRSCIDYVLVHELCHLIHPDHSADFYRLLSSVMPDWEQRKMRLERLLC
jgi:predicted metal-dependent hydrolase